MQNRKHNLTVIMQFRLRKFSNFKEKMEEAVVNVMLKIILQFISKHFIGICFNTTCIIQYNANWFVKHVVLLILTGTQHPLTFELLVTNSLAIDFTYL